MGKRIVVKFIKQMEKSLEPHGDTERKTSGESTGNFFLSAEVVHSALRIVWGAETHFKEVGGTFSSPSAHMFTWPSNSGHTIDIFI